MSSESPSPSSTCGPKTASPSPGKASSGTLDSPVTAVCKGHHGVKNAIMKKPAAAETKNAMKKPTAAKTKTIVKKPASAASTASTSKKRNINLKQEMVKVLDMDDRMVGINDYSTPLNVVKLKCLEGRINDYSTPLNVFRQLEVGKYYILNINYYSPSHYENMMNNDFMSSEIGCEIDNVAVNIAPQVMSILCNRSYAGLLRELVATKAVSHEDVAPRKQPRRELVYIVSGEFTSAHYTKDYLVSFKVFGLDGMAPPKQCVIPGMTQEKVQRLRLQEGHFLVCKVIGDYRFPDVKMDIRENTRIVEIDGNISPTIVEVIQKTCNRSEHIMLPGLAYSSVCESRIS